MSDKKTNSMNEHAEQINNYRVISPSRMVIKRFFRSKLSIAGLCMVIFVLLFSFLGPVIVNLIDPTYSELQQFAIPRETIIISSETFTGGDGTQQKFFDKSISDEKYRAPISSKHLLGTDTNGYDVFVRLMYGGRISLLLAFLVIFVEMILGVLLGGLAGYFGKWIDMLIMRICDVFFCLPTLPILLIISAMINEMDVIPTDMRIYVIMGFLTLIGWSGIARMVRGQILMLREQEYMVAAEAIGLSSMRKIFRHLIPNVVPQLIVSMSLGFGGIILYESTLSFLNLGVPFPKAAWGTMMAAANPSQGQEIIASYPNLWIPAGFLIVITVLGFNFVGDGLRDAFDPKAKR